MVGKKVPEFNLPMTGERNINDKDLLGQKTIIFFYPKDNTPG